jgi:hypothetical protein
MALTEASPVSRVTQEAGPKFRITLKAGESCVAGDALGYSSGWMRALATTGAAIQTELIALEAGSGGDVIEVCATAVIGGFTGGTPGGAVYQAEGSASGQYTETAPSTGGDVNTIIGVILSASEILVWPGNRAPSTA